MMKKFFILSAICALMCSCGSQKKVEGNTADLYGEWIIEKAMGLSTEGGEKQAFIKFAPDGKMNGNASVNSFFGGYELKGDTLKLGNVGMTRMMGHHMEIETAVTQALGQTHSVKVKGSKAQLLDKDGRPVMQLVRAK